jgi:hypothetical protein
MTWTVFILLGLFFLPLIISFLIGGVDLKHKLGGALVCLGFWAIMGLGIGVTAEGNKTAWNDGFCPDCEQHWELVAVTKTRRGSTTKYYTCPECYKEIQINS